MIAAMLALFAALQAPLATEPGEVQIFGDWAVGCDNGLACEAISLPSEDWGAGNAASITVRRGPGADGYLRVGLYIFEEIDNGALTLRIDGDRVATFTDAGDAMRYETASGDIRAALTRIAEGAEASLLAADGTPIDTLSLTGSAAALRFIDSHQQRAGTVGAAVARGDRPDNSVPEPTALPNIELVLPADPDRPVEVLSATRAMALHLERGCDGIDGTLRRNEAMPLDDGRDLILISCSDGAYNFGDVAFVREGDAVSPARFDRVFAWGEDSEVPLLVNVDWSPSDGVLRTYAKGRGIGDCGTAERFVWDGSMFRLIERREMNSCRGSPHWITVWRANTVTVGSE